MKKERKEYCTVRFPLRPAILLLAATAVVTAVLFYLEAESYRDKVDICVQLLAAEQEGKDNFTAVTEILKYGAKRASGRVSGFGGGWRELSEAEERLLQYGYKSENGNVYRKGLYRTWGITAGVTGSFYGISLLILAMRYREEKKHRTENLEWVCGCLKRLRDNTFELVWEPGDDQSEGMQGIQMELNSLYESLSLLRKQAEWEREEIKSLVTDISHQLKTPVAALKVSFENLQMPGLVQGEKKEFEERCAIQILRLEELVGALVNISRMETGVIQIHRENKNLFDTLLLAVNRIYPDADKKGIELEFCAEEDLQKISLPHDVKWLSEAIINVLENAVKYSPSGSKIMIRMIKMTLFLRIEIEDEGIGIPKEEWNEIFKRFYRGKSEAVRHTSGSGVGLYLAREILSRHGGTLTVREPADGHGEMPGSLFVFQLPYF